MGRCPVDNMGAEVEENEPNNERPEIVCADCGQAFKTAQGLAGHRRLAHSTSTARELEERTRELETQLVELEDRSAKLARIEQATKRREAELTRRKREIEETGPSSIGLSRCDDCGAWFETVEVKRLHKRTVHPIDEAVAREAGVSRWRVHYVWTEACRFAERRPDKSVEEIIKGFWLPKDREILQRLRRHNAAFRFTED